MIFWLFSARPALAAAGTEEVAAPWGPISVAAALSLLGLAVYLTLAARPIIASGGHLGHGTNFPLDFASPFGWTPFAISMRVATARRARRRSGWPSATGSRTTRRGAGSATRPSARIAAG